MWGRRRPASTGSASTCSTRTRRTPGGGALGEEGLQPGPGACLPRPPALLVGRAGAGGSGGQRACWLPQRRPDGPHPEADGGPGRPAAGRAGRGVIPVVAHGVGPTSRSLAWWLSPQPWPGACKAVRPQGELRCFGEAAGQLVLSNHSQLGSRPAAALRQRPDEAAVLALNGCGGCAGAGLPTVGRWWAGNPAAKLHTCFVA